MFIKQAIQLSLRKTLVNYFWEPFQLSKIPSLFLKDFIQLSMQHKIAGLHLISALIQPFIPQTK